MSYKEIALQEFEKLEDDAGTQAFAQTLNRIYLRAQLAEAEKDKAEGRVYDHETVLTEVAKRREKNRLDR